MQLTCHKCHHVWNDTPEAGAPAVMCPECYAVVPMVLAAKNAGGNVHEERTVIQQPPSAAPSPMKGMDEQKTFVQHDMLPPKPAEPARTPAPAPAPAQRQVQRPPSSSDLPTMHMQNPGQNEKTVLNPSAALKSGIIDSEENTHIGPSRIGQLPDEPRRPKSTPESAILPPEDQTVMGGTQAPHDPSESPTMAPAPGTQVRPASPPPSQGRSAGQAAAMSPGKMDLSGQTVGGYQISKKLGAGGMGAVFQARQLSLDRDVAMKVLPGQMAANPELLARFTREALSAAQLTHHNVIQVYDVGSVDAVHFITMEFVRGASLGDLIRKEGKLMVEDAAAYVLQAARGLKYAHENGVIHRDIKPDNLMVNEQGIVKIADMGLAKMRGHAEKAVGLDHASQSERDSLINMAKGDITVGQVAMGTPAYMPPEQARDAGNVDHRADMYSLGCTLYYMIAGRAPYQGTTAYELITKHINEPLTPLEAHVRNVPPEISAIIQRMLMKDPADRYPSMAEVIADLEAFLGVASEKGPYQPREQHLKVVEMEEAAYYVAPSIRKRKLAMPVFLAVVVLGMVIGLFGGMYPLAAGMLGVGVLTPLIIFIIDGVKNKRLLFRRVRSVFFGMTVRGWATTVLAALVITAVLVVLKLLLWWVLFGVLAAGLAIAYEVLVKRPLAAERAEPLAKMNEMLKQLRVRGVSEEQVQEFVWRFGGENWEEFFEDLFGYEAMILMRQRNAAAEKVKPRKRYGTWRDPLFRWLDDVEESRRRYRERRQLEKVEKARIKATGVSDKEAEQQAEAEATRILAQELLPTAQKAKATSKAGPMKTVNLNRFKISPKFVWGVVRFFAGSVVALTGALPFIQDNVMLPGFITNFLTDTIGGMGSAGTIFGLAAGVAVMVTAFSGKYLLHVLTILGLVVVTAHKVLFPMIPVSLPMLTEYTLMLVGLGLVGLGTVLSVLSKLGGGRF